jgi:hypothetical protein
MTHQWRLSGKNVGAPILLLNPWIWIALDDFFDLEPCRFKYSLISPDRKK